jgi:DUF4097 and DUF4098 domain-containing protein YvlB
MTTKSLTSMLLMIAVLAVAAPALGQQDPSKDLSKLADLSKLQDLAKLGELSRLPDLSRLDHLQLPDLSALGRLSELAVLSELGDVSAQVEAALRDLPDLHASPRLRVLPRALRHQNRQGVRRGPEQTEKFSRTFRVGPNASLDVSNVSGDITVTAGSGDQIVVDATKRTPQGADAQQQLQAVTIEAVERAGRVEVRTRYPQDSRHLHTSVDYAVTVPPGTAANIHSVSGDVHVTNVKGALRIDCVSGDVQVENADQVEGVKSVSGDVTVTGGAGNDARVGTINGELTVRNFKVRSLDASTVAGDVKLTDVAADRAVVKTMSGDVDYVGPFAHGGRYEFTAHSGDVRLTPTSNTGFEINADTFSGEIRTTMPITLKEGQLQARVRHEIRGTYGDGSALVTVKTFSGGVVVGKGGTTK